MKTKNIIALALGALGTFALAANAQDSTPPNDGPPGGGNGMRPQHPPLPAIVRALDANHDGVIDASEIANASAALKTLDKNGDGKLTPDEFMGPRPQMHGGQGGSGNDNLPPPGPPPQGDN